MKHAEIFLLDEITAALDPHNSFIIKKYFFQENKTVLLITHNLKQLSQNIDKIIVLKSGKIGPKNFEIQRNFFSLSPLLVSNTWSLYLHITCRVFTINIHFYLTFDYFIFAFFLAFPIVI